MCEEESFDSLGLTVTQAAEQQHRLMDRGSHRAVLTRKTGLGWAG